MARWFNREQNLRATLCVLQQETNIQKLIDQIPSATEMLTILQAPDAPNATVTESMLSRLSKLRGIDFQGSGQNPYKLNLGPCAFRQLHDLQYISLQKINFVGKKVFDGLKSVEVLQISECDIEILSWRLLAELSSLQEIALMRNGITFLEDFSFYGTPDLKRLSLSHNNIVTLQAEALVGLLKLEVLDLSNNNLDRISGVSFPPLPHLQWLELKHNPIEVIFPNCFQFLNGTYRLSLGHAEKSIHLLKFSFRGLENLIYLHIPNVNNDILLEHMFYGLNSLTHLTLEGRITAIGDRAFIGAHRRLERLSLHKCKLTRVAKGAFHGLNLLISLDLSSNKLRGIARNSFENLERLRELILNDNMLHVLPNELFLLPQLRSLRLDANSWNCTCEMASWREDVTTRVRRVLSNLCPQGNHKSDCMGFESTYVVDPRVTPRCDYPPQVRGITVYEVIRHHLDCYK
ncbi:uncharacterized protein LOC143253514 [Tachypleus tridentatus]|uniref:uncharacterized protein LOC143253514 n=1 Tax=Tachypleus tridentatus TaxID=6853 RepID=UPI003FD57FCF